MSQVAELRCRCGEVSGRVDDASPQTVNRVICCCDDCQAFSYHLGRADLLDAQGGSDIVQVAPAALSFHRGADRIVGLRLTPKGPFRWYSSCCNTPLGNTTGPAVPFVGIVVQGFQNASTDPDALFGKSLASDPRVALSADDSVCRRARSPAPLLWPPADGALIQFQRS